jgi:hypothetical protein
MVSCFVYTVKCLFSLDRHQSIPRDVGRHLYLATSVVINNVNTLSHGFVDVSTPSVNFFALPS